MKTWISLGSNLGDRKSLLTSALRELDIHPRLKVLRSSSFYRTSPWGVTDQPDFINAVAELESGLDAPATLAALQEVESRLGRNREGRRWGPRTIDIDLLLYGDEIYLLPDLRVPHPRMHRRRFVLEPLAELDGDLLIPGRGTVARCLRRLVRDSVPGRQESVEKLAGNPVDGAWLET